MDGFREWISDNLRYILLGIAIILVVVIAIFAVKLIGGGSTDKPAKKQETETQQAAVVVETETQTEPEQALPLVKDDQKILEVVQNYYTAVANKDIDTLRQMIDSLDEKSEQKILNNDWIESYNNISTYSKDGPVAGSYVVYTYYEAKLIGVQSETLAPGLRALYLCTREDGSLYIADASADESVKAYTDKVDAGADVQALIKEVEDKHAAVLESDAELAKVFKQRAMQETEVTLPDASDVDVTADKQVAATEVCNVRADSTETAEILGMLAVGEKVTRVQKLDNGWSEIRYGSQTAYVMSDYLTEDVSSVATE